MAILVAKSTLMALAKDDRDNMTTGQVLAWRQYRYDNLHLPGSTQLRKEFLLGLPDLMEQDDFEELKVLMPLVLQGSVQIVVPIVFDSSVVCRCNVLQMSFKIQRKLANSAKLNMSQIRIVIVNTYVGEIENRYKLEHRGHYRNVNFDMVSSFLNLCSIDRSWSSQNLYGYNYETKYLPHIYNSSIYQYHRVMSELEYHAMDFGVGTRNEINDNTQLVILEEVSNVIGERVNVIPMICSNDRGLLAKCGKYGIKGVSPRAFGL
jgi:hypothetical protein